MTKENADYGLVFYTGKNSQLVVMSLKPGEEIGEEVHYLDQFIRVEVGEGRAMLDGEEHQLGADETIVIPQGTRHNLVNTGSINKDRNLKSI